MAEIIRLFVLILFLVCKIAADHPVASLFKQTNLELYLHSQIHSANGEVAEINGLLTQYPSQQSKVLGRVQGTSVLGAENCSSVTFTAVLNNSKHKNSISFRGSVPQHKNGSEISVVSGTGQFRFATGFALVSPVQISPEDSVYFVEATLYHS